MRVKFKVVVELRVGKYHLRPTIECHNLNRITILQLTVSGLPGAIGQHVRKHVGMVSRRDPEE